MNQSKKTKEDTYITLSSVQSFQLVYKRISVVAEISVPDPDRHPPWQCIIQPKKSEQKIILKQCSGAFQPYTFTAIVGPSGCGKTTMLNLLSGRLVPSSNLSLYGVLSVNGQDTQTLASFKDHVGYVMQQDYMLPTFSPKQSFEFIANLRLPEKTPAQRAEIVNEIINSLGLSKCQDTFIGNNIIRGISGGQRKRTSIGLQLLVNPSILFLDQPTTGLDSTTALNLVQLLKAMARSGRTIVSTIHQPSSEIFLQFDKLLLMVQGNIVYNGDTRKSMDYFRQLGKPVPLHANPLDYYMRMMNKEGIQLQHLAKGIQYNQQKVKQQFKQVLNHLIKSYNSHSQKLQHAVTAPIRNNQKLRTFILFEFLFLLKRSFLNQFRNPVSLLAKILQAVFYAIICIILFEKEAKNFQSFDQNMKGLLFFLVMIIGFGGIFSSVNSFSDERPVFIRQKLSNSYNLSSYFIARLIASLPLIILVPIIALSISYWFVNLHVNAQSFFLTILGLFLINWMSTSYGFLLSAVIPSPVTVTALIPILLIPFMLVAGFFSPLSQIHDVFRVFQYLSPFKYGYQSLIQIQYRNGGYWSGFDKVTPNILQTEQYNFDEPLWLSLTLLFVIGVFFYILAFIGLWYFSMPHDIQLQKPTENPQLEYNQQPSKGNILQITLKYNENTSIK